jgi:hypothetical protein
MPHEITCPTCQHTLHVAAGTPGRWLTCPRCLASVGNPFVLGVTDAPARPPVAPPPEPAAGEDRCPGCGRAVDRGWRLCPFCAEPLGRAAAPRRPAGVDEEVQGDSKGVGLGLIALGMLGAVGMVLFLCGGGLGHLPGGQVRQAVGITFVAGILFLGLVVAGMTVSATGRRAAGRIAAIALGAAATVLLALVLVLTAFIYSVASCFEGCPGGTPSPGNAPAPKAPAR